MTLLSFLTVLGKRALPKRWSSFVIALTVVYFFLLLAGLGYAGWFHVA